MAIPEWNHTATSDPAQDVARHSSEWLAALASPHSRQQMDNVRDAFRLRRLARNECLLHALFEEHSMFGEARAARREMMQLLYSARDAWRLALGLKPSGKHHGCVRLRSGRSIAGALATSFV